MPYLIGRLKKKILDHIKERIAKKTNGWKEKLLSTAAKKVLIKSVLQATPTYVMSLFLLPQKLCEEISSLCMSFW